MLPAPGHVLLDRTGEILEADDGFGAMLRKAPEQLRGIDVLSITAPADRAECGRAIASLLATGRGFDMVKRFIRDDESVFWVRNTVSRMSVNNADLIVATCALVPDRPSRRTPEALLESARWQIAMLRERTDVCDPRLLSGPGWQMLLEIYVAEAEGRTIDTAELAGRVDHVASVVDRWIAVLHRRDILEIETADPRPDTVKVYRLTGDAVDRFEGHLARFAPVATQPA